jgi:murein DD-endopeptidase MepM/ murein hydrolase activator NlpD
VLGVGVVIVGLAASPEFRSVATASPTMLQTAHAAIAPDPVWKIDFDGDGTIDLANPTHSKVRGVDAYGSGKFGARRDGGRRKHEGADFIIAPGAEVAAPLAGTVTDIGFAYDGKEKLNYIEIKNAALKLKARVFYVDPSVAVGQTVAAGDALGVAEDLALRYPGGITNHVHVELRDAMGILDPEQVLPLGAAAPLQLAALRPQ